MPILKKNTQMPAYPKGSKTATGSCSGHHPSEALLDAVENFVQEHGYEPEQDDRLFITTTFTTFETIVEVIERNDPIA